MTTAVTTHIRRNTMAMATAMIAPMPASDKDVGMLVGGPFDGEEEEGNVVVIISDCRTVAGDGVMSEDVFTQSPVGI
jgi:hypothetical protein